MIKLPEKEKAVVFARRHWIVILGQLVITMLLSLLILGLAVLFLNFEMVLPAEFALGANLETLLTGQFPNLVWWITSIALLFIWLQFMTAFTDYFLDIWVVTDKRIIDIEQKGLFNREFSEFRLERIQDVTVEVRGILPTLLHYGDVHVQTAGEAREFIFLQVPYPHKIKNRILKAFELKLKQRPHDQVRATKEE
jgi:uncharacterized membrane protein YdbT with pleckstrin-like domain